LRAVDHQAVADAMEHGGGGSCHSTGHAAGV
jgi:hypothetical protein